MIRGNWNLSDEFKKNEKRQVTKIQQRQKIQNKKEKLQHVDPVKLYFKIERLENNHQKTEKDEEYLKSLKEDLEFIKNNKLASSTKLHDFLQKQQKKEELKLKQESKLWKSESVYFNPELNPLGKVPSIDKLNNQSNISSVPNLTISKLKKGKLKRYDPDPLIQQLNIKCPSGEPPRFYKLIQNTSKPKRKAQEEDPESEEEEPPISDDDSDEDDEPTHKKIKLPN
ncbi:hypothetical protein SBY92_001591 [Candida maltosa Xu316]|uniref:Uncharacterized protein n=1 Tax=Candida maltosa (strain Xu316) TaxID=1245528 RepID=M3K6C8_CANMX|nr:hypothetical protein G210_0679 [Candida maltosa Xu316]